MNIIESRKPMYHVLYKSTHCEKNENLLSTYFYNVMFEIKAQ